MAGIAGRGMTMGTPKLIRDVLAERVMSDLLTDPRVETLIVRHLVAAMVNGELDLETFDKELQPLLEKMYDEGKAALS
jgi:hypothetical protein